MKKIIIALSLLIFTLSLDGQILPCNLQGASIYIDNTSNPRTLNASVNGMSMYSYSWVDTNGVIISNSSNTPFYSQWCITITDLNTGCDTLICQDCVADTNALCMCPMIYMPVCGCDGVMYSNYCIADCADVPWIPATSNGMPGGFLPCSTWVPSFGQSSCGVEILGDSIICNLWSPQVLTASPNAATTLPVNYQWSGNGMSSNSSILTITSPGTYCVTQIDANGCIDSACINITLQDISIYTVPSPPVICLGDSIVLEIDTFGLANIIWFPNTLSTPPVHRIVDFPLNSHNYVVEAVDSAGCDRRGEVFVQVDSCNTGPCAIPFLYVDFDTINNMLEASQVSSNFSYQWTNGDTTHYTGYYPGWCLYVVDLNGCDTTICESTILSILNKNDDVKIYPNPTKSDLTFEFIRKNKFDLQIFDLSGKLHYSNLNIQDQYILKAGILKEGIYIVKVIYDDGLIIRKIMIE